MKKVTCLFVDVGGVLLTNGWDHAGRVLAASKFSLDLEEMESRHRLTFDTYEVGKLSLEDYLARVVFYKERSFSRHDFQDFMFSLSQPYPEMLELIASLKAQYGLKVVVVSNEGRELTEHRIQKFNLASFVDFFVSSCFVHFRKPDTDIYQLALDGAQVPKSEILYIDDREMFIQVAMSLGIQGLHHTDYASTLDKLSNLNLRLA